MKKFGLLILIICFTGCFGETGQGYLNVTCSKEETTNKITSTFITKIKHKNDNIISLNISYKYETNNSNELNTLKQSLISESNILKDKLAVTINEDNNYYEIIYDIDYSNLNEDIKSYFYLEDSSSKQVKYYEKLGYSCK